MLAPFVWVLNLVFQTGFLYAKTQAGDLEMRALSGVLTGNIGLAIGLGLTVWGIWKTFVSGDTGVGIVLLVCGVAVTIFPGVFNFAQGITLPIIKAVSGG